MCDMCNYDIERRECSDDLSDFMPRCPEDVMPEAYKQAFVDEIEQRGFLLEDIQCQD